MTLEVVKVAVEAGWAAWWPFIVQGRKAVLQERRGGEILDRSGDQRQHREGQ